MLFLTDIYAFLTLEDVTGMFRNVRKNKMYTRSTEKHVRSATTPTTRVEHNVTTSIKKTACGYALIEGTISEFGTSCVGLQTAYIQPKDTVKQKITHNKILRDFKLLPRGRWQLRSSGLLHNE